MDFQLQKQKITFNNYKPKILIVDDESQMLSRTKTLINVKTLHNNLNSIENVLISLKKILGPALEIIRHHHEKLNGSGYPDGLRREEISIASRIMGIVDIYDALITDHSYHRRMPKYSALNVLRREMEEGKLDPEIVNYLIKLVE